MKHVEEAKPVTWLYGWVIVYVLSCYLFPFIPRFLQVPDTLTHAVALNNSIATSALYVPLIFTVLNIVIVGFQRKKVSREQFLICTLIIKYSLIPLFLVGGGLVVLLMLLTFLPVPIMIFVGPIGAVAVTVFGWIILLGSAPFAFAYLTKSKQAGIHSRFLVRFAKLLQFFFIFDVIAIMVLSLKERKWQKLTVIVLLLLVGLLAVLVVLIRGVLPLR